MRKVKFTKISNARLLQVFTRYRGPRNAAPEGEEEIPTPMTPMPAAHEPHGVSSVASDAANPQTAVTNDRQIKNALNLPRARRMVFSSGRRLFMPVRSKEIKIRFVLNADK